MLDFFFPESIPMWAIFSLITFSFVTSATAATIGLGGGVAMMGAMSSVMPVNVLIAVHGLVQLGSNTGRAILRWKYIDWRLLAKFSAGAVIGSLAGGIFFVNMPEKILMVGLGAFILWMTWGPKVKLPFISSWGTPVLGVISAFMSMFLGASGPFVNAFLYRMGFGRLELIATQAACLFVTHLLKIIIFVSLGVTLGPWIGLIILMIGAGFAGTLLGTYVLDKLPEQVFKVVLKIVLTAAALNLLYGGLFR